MPFAPVPKERARVTKRGFAYTPKKTKEAEKLYSDFIFVRYPNVNLTGALEGEFEFNLIRPKSVKRRIPTTRPDLDNYVKLILDAFQKSGVFKDDSQFNKITAWKWYSESGKPSVRVKISEPFPDCT